MVTQRIRDDIDARGIDVFECPLRRHESLSSPDGYIGMRRQPTQAQENTVLGHEVGHFLSGAFYNAFSAFAVREQAEYRAFLAAALRYVP